MDLDSDGAAARFLVQLVSDTGPYRPSDGPWLGAVVADPVTAVFAGRWAPARIAAAHQPRGRPPGARRSGTARPPSVGDLPAVSRLCANQVWTVRQRHRGYLHASL